MIVYKTGASKPVLLKVQVAYPANTEVNNELHSSSNPSSINLRLTDPDAPSYSSDTTHNETILYSIVPTAMSSFFVVSTLVGGGGDSWG